MFTTPFTYMSLSGPDYDPDAKNYIDAVIAAGGTLSFSQKGAIDTFYLNLKNDGIYSKFYFFHPFLGGVANSNKLDGVNPGGTYDLSFQGTWTHGASGSYTAQNSSNYADTNFDFSTSGPADPVNTWSFGYMMADNDQSAAGYGYMGIGPSTNYMLIGSAGNSVENFFGNNNYIIGEGNQAGFINSVFRDSPISWVSAAKSTGSAASSGFVFSPVQTSTYIQTTTPTTIYYNKINPTGYPTGGRYLFAWGGEYLTPIEANNFLIYLNDLQVAFSRNIFS